MNSRGAALQAQLATDRCPWCGSEISRAKFVEIEKRIAEEERKKLAQERARMEQQIRSEVLKAEAKAMEVAEKQLAALVSERDKLAAKTKEIEARQDAVRREAIAQTEARLKAESAKTLSQFSAEREQTAAKLKRVEEERQKALEQQRAALEKDRATQLLKLQAEHNRERDKFLAKIEGLNRQVQRKTADELGEGAEVDVYEALRDVFAHDEITRIKRGQPGADIRHRVLHKGIPCGTILIDSKNRQGWQHAYVTKLREDQVTEKAEYAILATTVFPSGKKELYVDHETRVIVVNKARAIEVVGLVRRTLVQMHLLGLSQNERSEKQDLLYKYLTSEEFRQHMMEASRLTTEILDLDVEEQRTHSKVWEKRGKMSTRLRNVLRDVDAEISGIVEGRDSAAKRR